MKMVEISNLNFSYKNNTVFENYNLQIDKGSFITITGKNSSGKTTLFKILSNKLDYEGKILIDEKSIAYNFNKKTLGVIALNSYNYNKKVIDLLKSKLEEKTLDDIDKKLKKYIKKTNIENTLEYNFRNLSAKEKILVMITIQLIINPKVIILENVFEYLDAEKEKIMKMFQKLNKKGTTIINITNQTEECLYGNEVIFLNDSKHIKTKDLNEDIFLENELTPPFMISLSSKLQFYNLINKNYLSMEKLVDDLWQ